MDWSKRELACGLWCSSFLSFFIVFFPRHLTLQLMVDGLAPKTTVRTGQAPRGQRLIDGQQLRESYLSGCHGFLQCSDLYDLGATPRVTPWLRKPPDVRPSLGRDFVRHSGFVFFWFAGNVTRALKQNSMIKHHSRTEGANCCGLAMDGACPTLRSTRRWCLSPLHHLRFHQPLLFASSLSLYLFT